MSNIFNERHWEQSLELLVSLSRDSETILLVIGPTGVGKTTMKQKLSELQSKHFVCCDIHATTSLTAEDITSSIEQDLDADINKNLLLLIDDAQNLSLDVIAVLLQLKQKEAIGDKLQIVLFATQDLVQKVSRSILKEDFATQVHAIQLEPKKESWQGLSPLAVGATIFFGISFCILAFLWPETDQPILAKVEQAQPQALPEPVSNFEQPAIASLEDGVVIAPIADTPTEPESAVATEEPVAAVTANDADNVSIEAAVVDKPVNSYEEKIIALEENVKALQQSLAAEQQEKRVLEAKLQKLSSKKKTVSKNNLKIGTRNSTNKVLGLSRGEKYILSLPGKNYTLQLLCTHEEHKAQSFIRDNKLQNTAWYYRSYFKGKHWYIVTYGNFDTKNAAEFALRNLPSSLKKLKPWSREIANIHSSIGNRKSHG